MKISQLIERLITAIKKNGLAGNQSPYYQLIDTTSKITGHYSVDVNWCSTIKANEEVQSSKV